MRLIGEALEASKDERPEASKGEARRLIAGGGIYVNDVALAEGRALGDGDLLHGRYVMLRKGKRQRHLLVSNET